MNPSQARHALSEFLLRRVRDEGILFGFPDSEAKTILPEVQAALNVLDSNAKWIARSYQPRTQPYRTHFLERVPNEAKETPDA